jgi:chromosome segregation ATPase
MCDAAELEQTKKNYRAVIDEYNKLQTEYNELRYDHEALQDLFVQEEYEHDEMKVKYNESQKNYQAVVHELRECVDQIDDLQAQVLELHHKVLSETK